jgi:hypothetical protein
MIIYKLKMIKSKKEVEEILIGFEEAFHKSEKEEAIRIQRSMQGIMYSYNPERNVP